MPTYFPLRGEGADRPKAPAVDGWQSPAYQSIDLPNSGIWLAIRTDGLVVIDTDNPAAFAAWVKRVGKDNAKTFMRKTPHGYHLYYRWTQGSPETQRLGIFEKTDIKAGFGAYVVWDAPGYHNLDGDDATEPHDMLPFNPLWIPSKAEANADTQEWSEMPDGLGNNAMAAFAGTFRKQGMDEDTVERVLSAINEITMTIDPMPESTIEAIAHSISRYEPDPDYALVYGPEPAVDAVTGEIRDEEDHVFMRARWMRPRPHPGWWWHPYLPKASLVIVEGQESVGKTMFAAWAATRIAMGEKFEGKERREARNVMWFATEDDPYSEILPRFHAAGYEPDDDSGEILIFNPLFWEREPRFAKDSDALSKLIADNNVGLVVFDPIRDYLAPEDGAESSNNNERALRPGLRALNRIAQQTGATILGGHHQNKSSAPTTRERSSGSNAFRQVPRHVNTFEMIGGKRAMSVEKANGFAHEYTVGSYKIDAIGDEIESTGLFVPGGRLHDFRTLDEWRTTMEKLEAEVEDKIDWGIEWNDVAMSYKTLDNDALAPTVEQIARDFGLDEIAAQAMRAELRANGYISSGNRWRPTPVIDPNA